MAGLGDSLGRQPLGMTTRTVLLKRNYDLIRIMRGSREFLRFGEYLAHTEALPEGGARGVAAEVDVPYTTLIEWWRQLQFQRAILDSSGGARVDRPRLLQVLTAHRIARLTPRFARRVAMDGHVASAILASQGIPHALAMLTAANEWTFFEPRREIQLYVPAARLTDVRRLLPAETGAPFSLEVFSDNPEQLPVVERNGVPVTNPFLTLLDCRAHPEGGAHANFIERNVIRWGR